jgi:predicted lipoprotein with Yx(FWY)xxD motif
MNVNHQSRFTLHRHATERVVTALLIAGGVVLTLGVTSASGALHARAKGLVISTVKSAKFGTILEDGRTLYTLQPDATKCAATCHKYWTQVLLPKGVSKATAGAGVNADKLGTMKVTGGRQVTYGGKALYWFFEDRSPGQVKGSGSDTWGKWSPVVLAKPAGTSTTTTTRAPTTTTTTKSPTPTTTTTMKTAPAPTTTTTAPAGGGGVGF